MGPTIVDAPPINVATIIVKTKVNNQINARGAIEPKIVVRKIALPTPATKRH